ncbi:signal peptidase I [Conexivisphaera calida]|uniref:Signal peptidase I n=1 Tax=Conexivisphaera calida TaxID=1874277 RepID=A0A4P2VG77_9ARCH|nr:signal peptidase I [Conexivisphaera calida]BBE42907.1 Signal peptidase I [Conexivisphaera calida]
MLPAGPKYGRMCKILRYAADAVLILAVISAALLLLNRLGVAFPVEGISMLPALHTGDLALVVPTSVSSVPLGDVVVYRSPMGIFVIHRVIERGSGYVVVKGDNNPFPDPWDVTNSMLVGRVFAVVDYIGYLALPPYTYSIALALVVMYVAYLACRRIGREAS